MISRQFPVQTWMIKVRIFSFPIKFINNAIKNKNKVINTFTKFKIDTIFEHQDMSISCLKSLIFEKVGYLRIKIREIRREWQKG